MRGSILLKEIKTLWKMNLKCILLHERSHTQNTTCYKILIYVTFRKRKKDRNKKQSSGGVGVGVGAAVQE